MDQGTRLISLPNPPAQPRPYAALHLPGSTRPSSQLPTGTKLALRYGRLAALGFLYNCNKHAPFSPVVIITMLCGPVHLLVTTVFYQGRVRLTSWHSNRQLL